MSQDSLRLESHELREHVAVSSFQVFEQTLDNLCEQFLSTLFRVPPPFSHPTSWRKTSSRSVAPKTARQEREHDSRPLGVPFGIAQCLHSSCPDPASWGNTISWRPLDHQLPQPPGQPCGLSPTWPWHPPIPSSRGSFRVSAGDYPETPTADAEPALPRRPPPCASLATHPSGLASVRDFFFVSRCIHQFTVLAKPIPNESPMSLKI